MNLTSKTAAANLMSRILSSALFIFLFISGCGYTQQVKLPHDIKTIAIETFKNEIPPQEQFAYRPGLEIELRNTLVEQFLLDGNLKVVDESEADAVLKGSVISFEQEGLRFDRLEDVEEYRLFLVVKFELIDRRTNQIIMKEPNFSGRSEFVVNRNPATTRRNSANSATVDLARSLVDRIVEEW